MINLIPNKEKKKMVKDIYWRILIVFFVAMGLAFSIVSIAILPYYYFSSSALELTEERKTVEQNMTSLQSSEDTEALFENLDLKLNIIEESKRNKYVVSKKIINEIINKKMPDIKINQITYENISSKEKSINIKGEAPSRERLLLFRLTLENNTNFKKVDLPISNFIQGSDIKFNLSIIPS
jgi:cell division protein FtsB